ncbi:ABC transporter substrate-binding protein [Aestuariivirga litoralis]|uniref:ABC transporter substrate-binding protein n=1 Tax=Aestuariivirga litoralis TaxID=2650924 RepID=A0A2W2B747_9HYPH|nr:ABC transporter substrate-binding protein [Aestuariivirga litoralis]PZF75878.1 ABC transporter substrate-binding protein [Aestuariivirga litoralis]
MRWLVALLFMLAGAPAALAETFEFPSILDNPARLRIEGSGDIEAMGPLIRDFQSLNPQVAITYVDTLTNDLFARLTAACDTGKDLPDLVFSSSVDHMVKLANDGCAGAHDSRETQRLPAHARWRDEVFGFTFEPAVIVYNRNLLPPEDVPHTRDELADLLRRDSARLDGKVGTYDIAQSGIGYLFAFFDAQESSSFGRLIEAFGRARVKLFCCTGELLEEIEQGRILIGYNLLGSYAYARMKAGAPIGIVLPRDYTLVLSRAAFVPAAAPNRAAGEAFLDYLLSLRGQQVVLRQSFFFAQGAPLPDGIDAARAESQTGITRPIPIGPDLLAVSDRQKRQRLLRVWNDSLGLH